jgi:anaerobic ribonucleoside-triphosphate reductase activating protein
MTSVQGTKIRWAGIEQESIVDGPGLRAVVFFQGCPHGCRGCHNPETWATNGGTISRVEEVWEQINFHPYLKGLTLSGGEPFLQPEAALWLGRAAKANGMELMVYTGYTWEEIMMSENNLFRELLLVTDILVDGPYMETQRDISLKFRGSRNQRIINVPVSINRNTLVLWEG